MTPTLKIADQPELINLYAERLLQAFWENGGKEKYEATKEMRRANGIPDKQWFAANLMGIIDDAEITYEDSGNI